MNGLIEVRDNLNYLISIFYTTEPECFIEATSFYYHILMLAKEANYAITTEDQQALDIVHSKIVQFLGF